MIATAHGGTREDTAGKVDPAAVFRGVVAVVAPHMDDEVLGCGGTLAALPDPGRVHWIYTTDGSRSPIPPLPWLGRPSPDLPRVRMEEAREAAAVLGIPEANLRFLGLPDGRLRREARGLADALAAALRELDPACLLVPFRYDRHPDHVTTARVAFRVLPAAAPRAEVFEYFVYHQWRLLPGGDVRAYLPRERLLKVDVGDHAARKRRALECFRSQTTRFFSWQGRPNLTPELLDAVCAAPEVFLRGGAGEDEPPFTRLASWIPVAHALEPALKRHKDRVLALLRWRPRPRGAA